MCLTVVLLFRCVVEDRNFALFNFVNEQNNEAEALRDQIIQVSVYSLLTCLSFLKFLPLQNVLILLLSATIEQHN